MMPSDGAARLRALTDLGSTLLVEAAAGTGKTALLAGRVTLLLARGVPPAAIAAITFTELAAGELSARVRLFVETLRTGGMPDVLKDALPDGLGEDGHDHLAAAAATMDELTTSTIHGFCQAILRDHAVSAGVDPGAEVMDADAAKAAFDTVFEGWLKTRLQGDALPDDPIAVLSAADPGRLASTLRTLARFRQDHRSARPVPPEADGRPDLDFTDAVDAFRRWSAGVPQQPATLSVIEDLGRLGTFYADCFSRPPSFAALWRLAHPERVPSMRWDSLEIEPLRCAPAWRAIAGDVDGTRFFNEASRHFECATTCFAALLGSVASHLIATLSSELDEVLSAYARFKVAAAVVDFDDLIFGARGLIRDDEAVRGSVAARYRHILVDEFQDTDRIQAEIIFRLAAEQPALDWEETVQRPGALFLVGDPKQGIYSFRGADPHCYEAAKRLLRRRWPDNVLTVTANFRSRPGVVDYVNRCFAQPMSRGAQPGYADMASVRGEPDHPLACASKITLKLPPKADARLMRETEANAVVDICSALIGALEIDDGKGGVRRLTAGDIALLTPAGTDLWLYERALNRRGISVASQAGKGFHSRQEVQDLMTLARVLADAHDTLAFGALMRGPLVGLTDEVLLDIADALHLRHGGAPASTFSVLTDAAEVEDFQDGLAARTLRILQALRRTASSTTPLQLLSEATVRLHLRAIVAARGRDRRQSALANVDAFLDLARGYAVSGLTRFVQDLDVAWRAKASRQEGRVDGGASSIAIVTVHGAKGAEWPVTIPINAATRLQSRAAFVHRASDDTLHWMIGDVVPPQLAAAVRERDEATTRERERLWYVAATRARELLVIPEIAGANQRSWARVVDLGHAALPAFDSLLLKDPVTAYESTPENLQDADAFLAEAAKIEASTRVLRWMRPSEHDPDRLDGDGPEMELPDGPATSHAIGAGRIRGLVLHALLEEILKGEIIEDRTDLEARASVLVARLMIGADSTPPDAAEMAGTVLATLRLPDVAMMRPHLIAEVPIHAFVEEGGERRPINGRADAICLGGDGVEAVVDWKSDVAPVASEEAFHRSQMRIYLAATGAPRGALIYVSTGQVQWVLNDRL